MHKMKSKESTQLETKTMILVPQDFLNNLMAKQEMILVALQNSETHKETIGDYISETDAKRILGRKSTWFWNLRKEGRVPFTKIGNKIFYSKAEILGYFEKNKNST